MRIGVLWAGLRVAMWITHAGRKFRHGVLEKPLSDLARRRGIPRVDRNISECCSDLCEQLLRVLSSCASTDQY